jgi:hypothetical protein
MVLGGRGRTGRRERGCGVKPKVAQPKEQDATYSVWVTCSNCGRSNHESIPRGTFVVDTPCPVCGCKTLTVRGGHTERAA